MLDAQEILEGESASSEEASFYFEDGQLAVARDSRRSDEGFCFAAHGSNNGFSHNHNDVGSCMLYYNGKPVLIDEGVGTYTKKTFSSERYTIWTMQSGFHNLPTINGTDQRAGRKHHARDARFADSGKKVSFSSAIEAAYPEEAGISQWIRAYTLQRGRRFTVADRWKLDKLNGEQILNFMTVCTPEVKDGYLLLKDKDFTLKMKYDGRLLKPSVESIPLTDKVLRNNWEVSQLYRIRLFFSHPTLQGKTQVSIEKP